MPKPPKDNRVTASEIQRRLDDAEKFNWAKFEDAMKYPYKKKEYTVQDLEDSVEFLKHINAPAEETRRINITISNFMLSNPATLWHIMEKNDFDMDRELLYQTSEPYKDVIIFEQRSYARSGMRQQNVELIQRMFESFKGVKAPPYAAWNNFSFEYYKRKAEEGKHNYYEGNPIKVRIAKSRIALMPNPATLVDALRSLGIKIGFDIKIQGYNNDTLNLEFWQDSDCEVKQLADIAMYLKGVWDFCRSELHQYVESPRVCKEKPELSLFKDEIIAAIPKSE